VKSSLYSILNQLNADFEVVVVDAKSTDGSSQVLRRLSDQGKINLLEERCSRGKGRQIALEHSHGEVIISNLDMDETYKPRLAELICIFHGHAEDKLLLVTASDSENEIDLQNITIGSRALIKEIGGWRNLNYGEDWDLWRRASKAGKFRWTVFPLITDHNFHPERKRLLPMLKLRYVRYKEMIRLGRPVFPKGEKVTFAQKGVLMLAKVGASLDEGYPGEKAMKFSAHDETYRLSQSLRVS